MKCLLLFIAFSSILLFSYKANAQEVLEKKYGFKAGLILNFGSHINQIGFRFNAFVQEAFIQVNLQNTSSFSFSNLAKRQNMFENRLSLGAMLLGGKRNQSIDFAWGGLRHQTKYQNAIGYTYLWYRDNRQTSQNSGAWTLQVSNFQLFFENDIFAGTGRDKFRTGHLMLEFRQKDFALQTGIQLWTGETRGSKWEKVSLDKCPSGFRLLEELPYGKTSHGILYGGITHRLTEGNFLSGKIGMDSEQYRHVFQNRLSHDLILFPKRITRKTPHYPRLDADGCAIFTKQEIRKPRFYSQLGLNSNWSY